MKCIKCNKEHDGSFGSGKYCSRACANSRTFTNEAIEKKRKASLGKDPWNKGLLYAWETTKCEYCGNDISHRKGSPKKYHPECWLKTSGGYRRGAGVGKKGWYKGYWCDSSYELAWIIYQLEHNIPFERNKQRFSYIWKNEVRSYIPDFIQHGQLLEIKGYVDSKVEAKLKSVKNLKVLFRKDLDKEFQYVETKYGKDFIKLYDKNNGEEGISTVKT